MKGLKTYFGTILFVVALLLSGVDYAAAQSTTTLSGRFIDDTNEETMPGVVIEIANQQTPDTKRYYTSEYGGVFKISGLRAGKYICKATFMGYADCDFTAEVGTLPCNVGDIRMKVSSIAIEAVVKTAVANRATMLGDTLRYNADAFKVAIDAEVGALLRKMPGIIISDGKVEAQGEEVKQIYVDGKEFFGSNIQQVLQSIPAQAVEHIEVYNRLSEAAQITGIDDGDGGKVINIITRQSIKRSLFGKVHIGAGYEPSAVSNVTNKFKYTAGGTVNMFNDESRFTAMALFNNLNKQNLTDDDIAMSNGQNSANISRTMSVNSQQGVAAADILAFNYSDVWGRRNRAKFEGSIFYNHISARNDYVVDRWYDEAVTKKDTIHYDQFSHPDNHTLRFRSRLDWKVGKRQKLVVIPNINYYNNSSINEVDTTSLRWGQSGYRWMPSGNDGYSTTLSASVYAQYSYRFLRQGRTLMIVASYGDYVSDGDRDYYSNGAGKTSKENPDKATIKYTYSRTITDSRTTTLRIQPTFRERIGRYSHLNISYRLQYQMRSRDLFNYATDADHLIDESRINRKSSTTSDGSFMFHQAGLGYRYGRQRNWLSVNLMMQHSTLKNNDNWHNVSTNNSYLDFVYNATLQWSFNQRNTLRVSANSSVGAPGVHLLLDVYDVSNSQYVSKGNPNLRTYTTHNYFARYTHLAPARGITFMLMGKATHIQHYMGSKITYSPPTIEVDGKKYNPIQLTERVNLDGYWSYEGRASIGFPVSWLGSNLNIAVGATYTTVPLIINDKDDVMSTVNAYSDWTLGSNISEKVDFTLRWRGTFTSSNSTLDIMTNRYFMQRATANVKVVLPLNFTFTTSAAFTHYLGITNDFNDKFLLWNVSIGKKVLNRLGEVELVANDILGQNMSFSRGVWAGYSQVRYNSTLGRCFLVRFTYNIRAFHTGPKRRARHDRAAAPVNRLDRIERVLNSLKF